MAIWICDEDGTRSVYLGTRFDNPAVMELLQRFMDKNIPFIIKLFPKES